MSAQRTSGAEDLLPVLVETTAALRRCIGNSLAKSRQYLVDHHPVLIEAEAAIKRQTRDAIAAIPSSSLATLEGGHDRHVDAVAELGPDPAVVTQHDLDELAEVEEILRSSGLESKADTVETLHGVLLRVSQGRSASHYRESYERAVVRLVLMRDLIPDEALRKLEVQWRAMPRQQHGDAKPLELPAAVRDQLAQMAGQVGAVAYSPAPLRAVRGVSLTFDQLDALAVLISATVWPVPGASSS